MLDHKDIKWKGKMVEKIYTGFKSKVAEATGLFMDQCHVHIETIAGETHL